MLNKIDSARLNLYTNIVWDGITMVGGTVVGVAGLIIRDTGMTMLGFGVVGVEAIKIAGNVDMLVDLPTPRVKKTEEKL